MKIVIILVAVAILTSYSALASTNDFGEASNEFLYSEPDIVEDPWTSDDQEDIDLYDIIIMSETSLGADPEDMTEEERIETVRVHNVYRGNFTGPIAPGSDVHYMEYNRSLEYSAKLYTTLCLWGHGRHPNDTLGKRVGQNLYYGASRSITRAIYLYYTEYSLYSYEDHKCIFPQRLGLMCTHFWTIMAGITHQVGCGRHKCHKLDNNYMSACHYWPRDVTMGAPEAMVYQIGRPCSRNPRGDGNLCHRNLCVNKTLCSKYNLDCTCESFCQNCGVHNVQKCSCECKLGWDWHDCADPCADIFIPVTERQKMPANVELGCRQFPKEYICHDFYYNMWCRKFCGECEVINPKAHPSDDQLCCGGKMCDRFYVLNDKCECEKFCPSKGCMFNVTHVKRPGQISFSSKEECISQLLIIISFVFCVFKILLDR